MIDNLKSVVDDLYKMIHNPKINNETISRHLDWLESPIQNLISKVFIPLIDVDRIYLSDSEQLNIFLDLKSSNIERETYNDIRNYFKAWQNRFIPIGQPVINEYQGISYKDNNNELFNINKEDITISGLLEIPYDKLLYYENMTLLEKKIM